MFDFNELRGRIRARYGTEGRFAEAMGLAASQLSDRLNGKVAFRMEEIPQACDLLGIPGDQVNRYFFTPKVR